MVFTSSLLGCCGQRKGQRLIPAFIGAIINTLLNLNLVKERDCMKKKKLLFAILCALGSGTVGFFANQLTEVYGCVLFGIGVGLMVYSIINLSK